VKKDQEAKIRTMTFSPISFEVNEIFLVYCEGGPHDKYQVIQSVLLSGIQKVKTRENVPAKKDNGPKLLTFRFDFNPTAHLPKVMKRICQWMKTNRNSLPRSQEGLQKSVTPFCSVRCQILSAEYILEKLLFENFLEIDSDGDPIIIERVFQGFPPQTVNSEVHYTHKLKEIQVKALTKAFIWLQTVDKPATTKEGLMNVLNQFCFDFVPLSPPLVISSLVEKNIIEINPQTKKIRYSFLAKDAPTKPTNSKAISVNN